MLETSIPIKKSRFFLSYHSFLLKTYNPLFLNKLGLPCSKYKLHIFVHPKVNTGLAKLNLAILEKSKLIKSKHTQFTQVYLMYM